MMDDASWYARVHAVLGDARAFHGAELDRFLAATCAGDDALRERVEMLLAAGADDDFDDAFSERRVGDVRLGLESVLDGEGGSHAPERIGKYRVLRVIAEGGMGIVYEAEQDDPRRRVALKVIRPALVTDDLLRRFKREAVLLGHLQHPGIAQIYEASTNDVGDTGERATPFLAMELVEGDRLDEFADAHDLDVVARLELIARLCDALHHAHQKGVVHRDLKPANILVSGEALTPATGSRSGSRSGAAGLPQPKILDFGVARAMDTDLTAVTLQTTEGQLVGTVPYMSPEQAAGDPNGVDARSDVYAVGLIAYELLAGCPPYEVRGKQVHEAVRIIREDEPSSLGAVDRALRGDVETIIAKALEKDRARRYESAAELAADVRRHLSDEPIAARPPSTVYQLRKFARRNKALVGGAAATLVVAVVGALVAIRFAVEANTRADELARTTYVTGLAAAAGALESGDSVVAAGHLDALDALPEELRGWEVEHLRARLAPELDAWDVPSPIATPPVFDADGRRMSAVMFDGTLGTWGLADGRLVLSRPVDLERVSTNDVQLHGPTRRLARLDPGGDVVIEAFDGRVEHRFDPDAEGRRVFVQAWDHAGARLLWLKTDPYELFVWEGGSSRVLADDALTTLAGRRATNLAVAFDRSGERVAAVGYAPTGGRADKNVWLLDAGSGAVLARREIDDIGLRFAFSPDGGVLAVGFGYRDVYLLDGRTLEIEAQLEEHRDVVYSIDWSPDGTHFVTSSKDGTVRIRDARVPGRSEVLTVDATFDERTPATAMGAQTGRRRWASVTADGNDVLVVGPEVQRYPLEDPTILRGHASFAYYLAFSPDGSLLASSGYLDSEVHVWDVRTGRSRWRLEAPRMTANNASTWNMWPVLAFSGDGRRLVASTSYEERQWDVATGEALPVGSDEDPRARLLATLDRRGPVRLTAPHLAIGPRGRRVAITRMDGVELFEARKLLLDWRPEYPGEAYRKAVNDLVSGGPVGRLEGHLGEVLCASFHPAGRRIATGGRDGTVRIWDAETFEELLVLRGHRQYVKDVLFSPDGTLLASASGDKTIRLWDSLPLRERRATAPPSGRATPSIGR